MIKSKSIFLLVLLPLALHSQRSIRFSVEGQTVIPIFHNYTNAILSEYILSFQGTDATIAATNGFDVVSENRGSFLLGLNAEYILNENWSVLTGLSFYQLQFDEIFSIHPNTTIDTYQANFGLISNNLDLLWLGPLFQPNKREMKINYYKIPVQIGYQHNKWSLSSGIALNSLKSFQRNIMIVDDDGGSNYFVRRATNGGKSSDFLNERIVTVSFGLGYEVIENLHIISSYEMYLESIYENNPVLKFLQNDYMDKSKINTLNVGIRYYFKQFDLN